MDSETEGPQQNAKQIDKDKLRLELEALFDPDGRLRPARVVEWAKEHPESEAHKGITWDDSEAAHRFRLWEARRLISVVVEQSPTSDTPIRVFVQLREDGEGYRRTEEVISTKSLLASLMSQLAQDLKRWEQKLEAFKEASTMVRMVRKRVEKFASKTRGAPSKARSNRQPLHASAL